MDLERAVNFIWENGRLLERAVFEYAFGRGPAERVLDALRAYQNADGGFGHALEPDLRAPDSQPLFVEFALHTLFRCGLRDPRMAGRACDFLARHADPERGIAPIFPSFRQYPRAEHWDNPPAARPTLDRLIGLVGLARWHGAQHPWLDATVNACLQKIAALPFDDAHTILPAFILLESVCAERDVEALFAKLAGELATCRFFIADAPAAQYGLTPLDFAPTPRASCRRLFTQPQIDAHLDDLASQQEADGGWSISWQPPDGAARSEWRAHRTVHALAVLKAYDRIGSL